MGIDKVTFNRLDIKDQIKVFNSILDEGNNIKEVCYKIGISYSTIRDRFQKGRYQYNKFENHYEKADRNKTNNMELENTLRSVITKINSEELEPKELDLEDDIVVRSFRIRKKILEDFMEYCNNSSLKQYDIISLFLIEGMNKYKKK